MTNKQITISKKPEGGKTCAKCARLDTARGIVKCLEGHDHFDARTCESYKDASVPRLAIFGGTSGMVLGGGR